MMQLCTYQKFGGLCSSRTPPTNRLLPILICCISVFWSAFSESIIIPLQGKTHWQTYTFLKCLFKNLTSWPDVQDSILNLLHLLSISRIWKKTAHRKHFGKGEHLSNKSSIVRIIFLDQMLEERDKCDGRFVTFVHYSYFKSDASILTSSTLKHFPSPLVLNQTLGSILLSSWRKWKMMHNP